MAEIVGAFGVPHTPFFPALIRADGPVGDGIKSLYDRMAETLRAVDPDVIVFFLPDHYVDQFETIPIFDIGVAPVARGPVDYPEQTSHDVPVDAELAALLHGHLVTSGFDVALSREPKLDHASIIPLQYLTPAFDVPIVPIRISSFRRPLPAAARCFALGRAVRAAVQGAGARRVAVMTTGNFSLDIGGPRMAEAGFTSIPDPGWVERVLELIDAGRYEDIVEEATAKQLDRAGEEAGETLLWAAMLGTFDPSPPSWVEPQVQFGQAFVAWAQGAEGAS
jgi:protocatechuate 4,5-dioxygenase beta chain